MCNFPATHVGGGEQPPEESISELALEDLVQLGGCEAKRRSNLYFQMPLCSCMSLASRLTQRVVFDSLQPLECSLQGSSGTHWSGFPCPPPGDLSKPGIEPVSLVSFALQEDSLSTVPPEKSIQKIKRQYGLLWLRVKGYLSRCCHQTVAKMREAAEIQKANSTGRVPRRQEIRQNKKSSVAEISSHCQLNQAKQQLR